VAFSGGVCKRGLRGAWFVFLLLLAVRAAVVLCVGMTAAGAIGYAHLQPAAKPAEAGSTGS